MTNLITITAAKSAFPGSLADELGALQAEIAQLRSKERKLKDAIAANERDGVVEGNFYRSTVSFIEDTDVVDWEAAFFALAPKTRHEQRFEHTKRRKGSVRINVRAKQTAAVRAA